MTVINYAYLLQGFFIWLGNCVFSHKAPLESYKVRTFSQMLTNPCTLFRFERLAGGGIHYPSGLCPAVPCSAWHVHILWCALAPNEPSKWFRFSHSLSLSQSCFLGAEEGGGPDTPVAFCLFIYSSLSKPAIRGNLQMRLRLMENIQLALYLKIPEIHTVFKIADDLSSARASSPPTSTLFPSP